MRGGGLGKRRCGGRHAQGLREVWMAISPVNYIEKFGRVTKKSKFIYTSYDTTFLPEFSWGNCGSNPQPRYRPRRGRAPLRALHHGRVAIQVCGWLSYLFVPEAVALKEGRVSGSPILSLTQPGTEPIAG